MNKSILVPDSLNSHVSHIASQVAVLVVYVNNEYTHQDIVGYFDMI